MILPTKHIPAGESLLGIGAILLVRLAKPHSVSALWDAVRDVPEVGTFQRFVLAADLLFLLGAIELERGTLRRTS